MQPMLLDPISLLCGRMVIPPTARAGINWFASRLPGVIVGCLLELFPKHRQLSHRLDRSAKLLAMEPWTRVDPTPSPLDGPLIGIRLWTVIRPNLGLGKPQPRMKGTNATYAWEPGPQEAVCNHYAPPVFLPRMYNTKLSGPQSRTRDVQYRHFHGEEVPVNKCVCGFHAFYNYTNLCEFFSGSLSGIKNASVIGLVRGWGKIHLHPNGWRSRWGEPVALFHGFYQGANDDILPKLAEIYKVPLLSHNAYPYIMGEFGSIVPDEMKPNATKP